MTLDGADPGTRWPLAAGDYAVHLLLDDGYNIAATAHFSVSGRRC